MTTPRFPPRGQEDDDPRDPGGADRYRARTYQAVAGRAILARMARRYCMGTKAARAFALTIRMQLPIRVGISPALRRKPRNNREFPSRAVMVRHCPAYQIGPLPWPGPFRPGSSAPHTDRPPPRHRARPARRTSEIWPTGDSCFHRS
jgi:hypothetical protein